MYKRLNIIENNLTSYSYKELKEPLRIVLTGAAGKISYSLAFHIASGLCFGLDQPLILNLLEIPQMEKPQIAVKMELQDCAFTLIREINC